MRRKYSLFDFFPLVWLVYLYFPVGQLLAEPREPWVLVLSGLVLTAFLVVWWRAFGLFGAPRDPLWNIGGFALCVAAFGAGYPLVGFFGVAFLIYAASIIGFQPSAGVAFWGLFVALTVMLVPVWFTPEGPGVVQLLPYMAFAVVGCYANFASYRQFVANERLRVMQLEKERLAQSAERERIARDLHDLLGHTLSVIVLKSELASKLAERDVSRAVSEIREVERISREALSEVRAAVRGYRGSGLAAELGRSKVALDAAGVRMEYEGEPLDLPPQVEGTMEMVLREAVTNVVRHSRARRCTIRVARAADAYELEVHDDGVGSTGPEGTGLTVMRERVRAVGGTLVRDDHRGSRLLARFAISARGESAAVREAGA